MKNLKLIIIIILSLTAINVSAENPPKNGDAPLNSCFGEGIFDGNAWIIFKSDAKSVKSDAIVCLINVCSDEVVRNLYVRQGSECKMESIPKGVYYIKVYYGNKWNATMENFCGTTGKFEENERFSKSDEPNDYIIIQNTSRSYTTGTITLYQVVNGNMSSEEINAQEFFTK
jgi:hypothetical protein